MVVRRVVQRVRQQPFRHRAWLIKGLDENPLVKKRKTMKLLLLRTCDKGELFAINPELILEIGNDVEDTDAHKPEDEVRVTESQVTAGHEAILRLARRPFKVGDRIDFKGLTRVTHLNSQVMRIRPSFSTLVAGYQAILGPGPDNLAVVNYTTPLAAVAQGAENGFVFEPEHRIKCGFLTCCSGSGGEESTAKKIETKETLQEILEALVTAGIATIHDPEGHIFTPTEQDRP